MYIIFILYYIYITRKVYTLQPVDRLINLHLFEFDIEYLKCIYHLRSIHYLYQDFMEIKLQKMRETVKCI